MGLTQLIGSPLSAILGNKLCRANLAYGALRPANKNMHVEHCWDCTCCRKKVENGGEHTRCLRLPALKLDSSETCRAAFLTSFCQSAVNNTFTK